MKVYVYSSHQYDRIPLEKACSGKHQLTFSHKKLSVDSARGAVGNLAVSLFTADDASSPVLEILHGLGVRYIALRSAGYDHVDLKKTGSLQIKVANVPAYSPYSIAEHATAMLLALNRQLIQSQHLIALQDFRLDTLTGFDIHGKTIGIIGTGKIGMAFARIMSGFGAVVIGYDPVQDPDAAAIKLKYVDMDELILRSDIISLHCPLNEKTKYLIGKSQFEKMKRGCILINTSRGGLVKTEAMLEALENSSLGGACLDVYEKEKGLFFEDHRTSILKDQLFARLRGFRNVLITGHQAFLTNEALRGIAETTNLNLDCWSNNTASPNELTAWAAA